jgi:hypothetical protein
LAYRTESYNCIAYNASPIRVDIDSPAFQMAEKPPSTDNSTPFTKLESLGRPAANPQKGASYAALFTLTASICGMTVG